MLTLVWRETALDDLDRIVTYIGERDFSAAVRLQAMIESRAERLTLHPLMYRQGRIPDTRESVVRRNYVLIYRITDESVEIVSVLHARQQYPPAE